MTAATTPRLQLVVPCFNEAARLNPTAFISLVRSTPEIALLFVNDGSTDRTGHILTEVAREGAGGISVLTLPRNAGKAAAVQMGIRAALERAPQFVGFWDADLATPLTAVHDLLDVLETDPRLDIVLGARVKLLGRNIQRSSARHYLGRLFATVASLSLNLGAYDTQCGAKLFRVNDVVVRAFAAPFRSRWIFDLEILSRYLAFGGSDSRIFELPLKEWADVPGSKLPRRYAVRALWDLAVICREQQSLRNASGPGAMSDSR